MSSININHYDVNNINELIQDLSNNYIVGSTNVTEYILDEPNITNHSGVSTDILDTSFANYKLGLSQYSEDQEEMKVLLSKYDSITSTLNNNVTTRNYVLFLSWFIIFIVIIYVTIMNMASNKPMTYMGMLFVIVFLTIVSYNIIRNLYLRNKGYNK
jgi:hypothetical protein